MDIPTEWMICRRNKRLKACAPTYVNHQRIACLEQKISARATVSQGWGYYHIRSYPLCWSHQATIKYLVWIWDSRQWSQSGWFRNSCDKPESVRKSGYASTHCLESEGPGFNGGTQCKESELGCSSRKSDHQFMDSCQYRHSNQKSLLDLWDTQIFQSW